MKKCDSCDIDLGTEPVVVSGKTFCCYGCSEGGPCVCTYEKEDALRRTNGHADPLMSRILFLESRDAHDSQPNPPAAN